MPIYVDNQGIEYDINTSDPEVAKKAILGYLAGETSQSSTGEFSYSLKKEDPVFDRVVSTIKTQEKVAKLEEEAPVSVTEEEFLKSPYHSLYPKQSKEQYEASLTNLKRSGKHFGLVGNVASLYDTALGVPGFVAKVGAGLLNIPVQAVTTGTVSGKKALKAGEEFAQDVSLSPEPGEQMPIGYLFKKLGLIPEGSPDYEEALITKGVEYLDSKINDTAGLISETTGMSQEGARLGLDTLLLAFPFAKSAASKAINRATDFKSEVSLGSLDTTKKAPSFDPKTFSDSLYKLNTQNTKDLTDVSKESELFKSIGVSSEDLIDLRLFEEGQAKGHEKRNQNIETLQENLYDTLALKRSTVDEIHSLRAQKKLDEASLKNLDTLKNKLELINTLAKQINLSIFKEVRKRKDLPTLSPFQWAVYSKYILPKSLELRKGEGLLMDAGRAEKRFLGEEFAPRMQAPKEKTTLQKLKEAIAGRDFMDHQESNLYVSDAAKSRAYFVLESPTKPGNVSSGKRVTYSFSEPTPDGFIFITPWNQGKSGKPIKLNEALVKTSLENGTDLLGKKFKQATTAEITEHIGNKYVENYQVVQGIRLAQIRDQIRKKEWVENLLNHSNFKEIGFKISDLKPGQSLPEGFRELHYKSKMPELREYAFENRYAEILDDYNKPMEYNEFITATNALITNMMLVPMIHIHNELFHWGVSRGLVGGVLDAVLNKNKGADLISAFKEVHERGPIFRQLLEEGGSVMSANIRNTVALDKLIRASETKLAKSGPFKELAKLVGRSTADLYSGMSKLSNRTMWEVRDVLYTQLIMQKMKLEGKTMREAIDAAERHMPNYRLPSRVGEAVLGAKASRALSTALNNKHLFIFSRYHHGMISSLINTIKDSLGANDQIKRSARFKEGVDAALASIVAYTVLYPMLDEFAESFAKAIDLDGSIAEAKFRRPGFLHVFHTAAEVVEGKKDTYALASLLATINPVLQLLCEQLITYELYNMRKFTSLTDDPEQQLEDRFLHALRKVPQIAQGMQATSPDYGTGITGIILRNFFDIQARTREQLERVKREQERQEALSEKKRDEY